MKKILLVLFSLAITTASQAQSFMPRSGGNDTVYASYISGGSVEVHNNITPAAASVTLKWKVTYVNFGSGWDAGNSGVCDNRFCTYDVNALMNSFNSQKSDPYTTPDGDFHVAFAANNPAVGSKAVVTIRVTDTVANYTRNLTFVVYRAALGIGQTTQDNSVSVYPNPARDFVNVVFDNQSDVKTIAIFNLIGKTMRVFKPTDNNSARLDLDNIPSGVYFVRLMNSQGQVVATRRFTRQ